MRILVVNADCLSRNSSANLCHLAYIRGLTSLGHKVVVLSADGKDYTLDEDMVLPKTVESKTVYAVSLYEKLSLLKRRGGVAMPAADQHPVAAAGASQTGLRTKIKKAIRSVYGVHGVYSTFIRKSMKYRDTSGFDFVLSLSTPVASHRAAEELLKRGRIRAKHWVQIWEDPWYSDAYGLNGDQRIFEEERRLLSAADRVCYVSPLTLLNQKKLYSDAAEKMYWVPLPAYYQNVAENSPVADGNIYGYFGDYVPEARNLRPFYDAARELGIRVNICGNPADLFEKTDQIRIKPRIPLSELAPIEAGTNVLVFLSNLRGGQIPGKIYQYSATSKTILFILDGTEEEKKILTDYFGQFNRYVFCENTAEDIARAVRDIERGDLHGAANRPLDCFAPEKIAGEILRRAEAKE